MRILIINNGLAGGGIERASTSLANYWSRESREVILLALYQTVHFFKLESRIKFYEPSFRYNGNKYIYTLRMMFWLRQQIMRLKPDIVLAFGESTNPYVLLALNGLRVPVFVSDRMHPKSKLPKLTFWLKKQLYPSAAGVIAQTQLARNVLNSYLREANIYVIPNPVNVIDPMPLEKLNRVVSVGRLETVKGHEYLIRAFAKLEAPNWELSIVGGGSLLGSLKVLAKKLQVTDRVIFHGHLQDFKKELSEASIFVLPSLKEGFPNALLEAMSVPLACISTDFMGVNNELIDDGINGIVVPVANVDAMAERIQYLIDSPKERLRLANNAIKVREQYAFSKIASRYLEAIQDYAE